MNKKLLALAVAGAFAAPVAAMADTGNVTVYGVVHASVDRTDNGDVGGTDGISTTKVSSNQSRIGFKGNEDLGNGLSAVWQIEQGVNIDGHATSATTGDTMVSRNTFVGLSGKSWGTALLGRHDTPYKIATRNLDIFADTIADNRNIMGTGHDIRANNVIAYVAPNFSGFSGAAAYVAGAEGATTSGQKKGDAWSLMGNYDNGPVYAALAWQRFKYGTPGVTSLGAGVAADADKTAKAWKIGGGYNAGAFKVGAVYEKFSDDLTTRIDRKAWTVNGAYMFGSNAVKLAYTKADDTGSVSNTGAKQWTLGFDHNFSKRTAVYALYSKLDNDTAGTYGVGTGVGGGAVAPVAAGADPSAWSFGVKHSF